MSSFASSVADARSTRLVTKAKAKWLRKTFVRRGAKRLTIQLSFSKTFHLPVAVGICPALPPKRSLRQSMRPRESPWAKISGCRQAAISTRPVSGLTTLWSTSRPGCIGAERKRTAMRCLREYCRLFYGPAEKQMHAFFTYCEENWKAMEKDKALADKALELFAQAQSKAEPESSYGKRLTLIDDFLKGLRMKTKQLGQKRGPVPKVRLLGDATRHCDRRKTR